MGILSIWSTHVNSNTYGRAAGTQGYLDRSDRLPPCRDRLRNRSGKYLAFPRCRLRKRRWRLPYSLPCRADRSRYSDAVARLLARPQVPWFTAVGVASLESRWRVHRLVPGAGLLRDYGVLRCRDRMGRSVHDLLGEPVVGR
ncbi:Uncharacterised protein [Chlamydia trachomatis]|nr:Uncharacterised protein [Chlamydia trachomatis]